MLSYDEIKTYWDNRAEVDGSPQSTTNDFYMRDIEHRKLNEAIHRAGLADGSHIADIGCGDGVTTIALSKSYPRFMFYGYDYSRAMIANAICNKEHDRADNALFGLLDIAHEDVDLRFDVCYTTRCLINLPSRHLQTIAIERIHALLKSGGYYFMIENFVDGHDEFNRIRRKFDLPEIPIRTHNSYFDEQWLLPFLAKYFAIMEIENISSSYYLASRIIYSKICQQNGINPDYHDIHHQLAARLPACGNFGPVKALSLKKL